MSFLYLQGDHNDCFFQEHCTALALARAFVLLNEKDLSTTKLCFY